MRSSNFFFFQKHMTWLNRYNVLIKLMQLLVKVHININEYIISD